MDFSIIKTTCILPSSHLNMSYHDAMKQLNPNFDFAAFITPFHNADALHAWIRTTEGSATKVNYYLIDNTVIDSVFLEFSNAVVSLTPTITVEKVTLTKEQILEKFLNNDSLHVRRFSRIRNLFD